MLRIVQNSSAAGAKSYYSTADYYSEGQELVGVWRGSGARRLGLFGEVRKQDWDAMCDNLHPATGVRLTPRRRKPRRIGYDFNFHAPKSLSLLYGLTRDGRLLDAFRASVDETMRDIEAEMQTRVRSAGRDEDRTTGNAVWGEFVHFTARPVGGTPDPHLHAHCFVFNTTWDHAEGRWKAGQFAGLKRDAPYFEAVFHSRLARRMNELGLAVERTRTGWELAGVGKETLGKFSRRTALIESVAEEHGITDPREKDALGAKTRQRKAAGLTGGELQELWRSRLTDDEADLLRRTATCIGGPAIGEARGSAREAVERAAEHVFERSAVTPERVLLRHALKASVGRASVSAVQQEFAGKGFVGGERDGRRLVTTREVLAEERRMIDFARRGRGACQPLGDPAHAFKREWLNPEQRAAVASVLGSHDRVVLVRGAAGVGKTSMAKETVEAIEASGGKVFMFAPSADASRGVLRGEGFAEADTVARLLLDERLQERARGQTIWIDEAGLIGSRSMARLFDLAERIDARVVLVGDRRQHGSVERGSALRLLEEEAGLAPAEIRTIQRQRGEYRQAVAALSQGRAETGLRLLDGLGWVREIPTGERYKALAAEYMAAVAEGKTALVVSPTHLEGEWITAEIRARLKAAGTLAATDRQVLMLENANLTTAERADAFNYAPGDVLVFHQNAKGHAKGERLVVGDDPLPLEQADRFQLYHAAALPLAAGDAVRITRNGTTADGRHRLNNGAVFTVKGFTRAGDLMLRNGWRIAKDYGHLAHAYAVTSHASQGKTVDRVIIGLSSVSHPAASREGLYVAVSRGRERATLFTDDRQGLLEAVSRSDERLTATEFVAERIARERTAALMRSGAPEPSRPTRRTMDVEREELAHER